MASDQLNALVREVESHVAISGWDQPSRLYALVPTAQLLAQEPQLAAQLGDAPPGSITPVEQPPLEQDLAEVLEQIGWPDDVLGAALVHEVVILPGTIGEQPPDDVDANEWASAHPDRRDARIAVAVMRDGDRATCIRVQGKDGAEDEIVVDEDLVPGLLQALAETLEP
ncbi:MAG: PPA1309 family protein [Actinomycetota bacterium]